MSFDGCCDKRLGNGCTCPCHRSPWRDMTPAEWDAAAASYRDRDKSDPIATVPNRSSLDHDCEHPLVDAFRYDDPNHETYGKVALWACRFCGRRFSPGR